ncbi:MAG: hypothetical protein HY329_25520 [Chloroflexi bacterium]|nr:hypothetical protein [Chloroflexota bacterium]
MSSVLDLIDDFEAINDQLYELGWTDGLPVVPPTEDRVERMLRGTTRRPDEIVATLEPKRGQATVEKIAVNAVMAACPPEYMPVIIAAVEAMGDPSLKLYSLLTATHNQSPLVLVNGPIARQLDLACGLPQKPSQRKASATIGRAIVLITINVAGIPGTTHVHTQEPITRYYHCVAENEAGSPWEPLHVERGYAPDQSTVTVFPANPPQHLDDMGSTGAKGVLRTLGLSAANSANRNMHGKGEPIFFLGPQHAHTIAKDGWSKLDTKRFLYENARLPQSVFSEENLIVLSDTWIKRFQSGGPESLYPMAESPEEITLVVMGGHGTHSLYIQTVLDAHSVTVPVRS